MTTATIAPSFAHPTNTLSSLPIVVLHVHSRCNCRCTMCDIWQTKETRELSPAQLRSFLPDFRRLGVQWVVLTGGEPLLHRDLKSICEPLRELGIKLTVLTTGLLLSKYAESASSLFDEIIVSIDGPPAVHDEIRRVERGFQRLAMGLQAVRGHAPHLPMRARTTVQKANHTCLRETVEAAKALPLNSISFLAADLTSEAFNRKLIWPLPRQNEIGLCASEVAALKAEIEQLISDYSLDIESGFISERPHKLRRIVQHFRAHLGMTTATAPLCNAPWTSAVIDLDGAVRPCFFHRAVGDISTGLEEAINSSIAVEFRNTLDIEANPICQRCVCSLNYRVS